MALTGARPAPTRGAAPRTPAPPRRRIAFLESYPHAPGGVHEAVEVLALGLPARGWSVEIVACAEGPALDRYRQAGIHVTVLPTPPALLRYGGSFRARDVTAAGLALLPWTRRLARHLRASGADLLDVADQRGAVMGAGAAALARIPWVWHVHATGSSGAIDRFGRTLARRCVVASNGAAAALGGEGHAVIPPALATVPDPTAPPQPGAAPRVVAAGRLHPVKGYDVLVEAAALLRDEVPGLTVEVYGGEQAGHEAHARALRASVERLGVHDVVRFCGHRPEPWRAWDGAALYVLPSREEAFGLALLEGMACGLPVVATSTAGPRDIIDDGRTGLLVPPGSAPELAAAIRRVLDDPGLARSLGAAARADVLRAHSTERFVTRTAELFDEALRG
jgi:glycosyltransferase involved in cell wall biosynthesis